MRPEAADVAAAGRHFDECIGPANVEASTRGGYQAAWRTVLTWGIAHDSVHTDDPSNPQGIGVGAAHGGMRRGYYQERVVQHSRIVTGAAPRGGQ